MVSAWLLVALVLAAPPNVESDYYRIVKLPVPKSLVFEVSGLDTLDDGRLIAATRKGEVWIVDGAYGDPPTDVKYQRFAEALHEPLGLLREGDASYVVQRGELTRIRDVDSDGRADEYLRVADNWGVTGNYHGYAYGPERDAAGNLWITLNVPIGKRPLADDRWRGWGMIVTPQGKLEPMCAGMRSPCGLGANLAGDVFYTDQQGNWIPTCTLSLLERGAFYGHADSLKSCGLPGSPIADPGTLPSGKTVVEVAKLMPNYRLPAVWFPYRKAGMSATDVLCDTTRGGFGPFAGQIFVGDFTTSSVLRVFVERVGGRYQGACFRFRAGFQCAVFRMTWGRDGSLFVGETNRGWNSVGTSSYGLERVVWTKKTPFEVKEMRVRPNGFELEMTRAVDHASAVSIASYEMTSYTYRYHSTYGSPEIDKKTLTIEGVEIAADGKTMRLSIDGLREGYVHELSLAGVRSSSGEPVLHANGYYTLNRLP
jgi:glucose/arabinose dehydrogenase